jgi:hypothetical protein
MAEDFGETLVSAPDEEEEKKDNKIWIIVVVAVVLCCCLAGIVAVVYGLWTYGDELFGLSAQFIPQLL